MLLLLLILVLISHVPLKRILAITRNIAQFANVYPLPVHRYFVTPSVTFSTELLIALRLTAYAAFLLFPWLRLLLLSPSRCTLARGWCGAFKLQLVHRQTHIGLLVLPTRRPICGTTFLRCFTGFQAVDLGGDEALAHRSGAGFQVAQSVCFILRLRVEGLLKLLMVFAEKSVELDLCGHKASDVVSTQTIVQLTSGGDILSSWVSLSCNPLARNMSSEYECKSFGCGWPHSCDVLLTVMHCIKTQVNDHVMKGGSIAGFSYRRTCGGSCAIVTTHRSRY
jgi:hypothetical protein